MRRSTNEPSLTPDLSQDSRLPRVRTDSKKLGDDILSEILPQNRVRAASSPSRASRPSGKTDRLRRIRQMKKASQHRMQSARRSAPPSPESSQKAEISPGQSGLPPRKLPRKSSPFKLLAGAEAKEAAEFGRTRARSLLPSQIQFLRNYDPKSEEPPVVVLPPAASAVQTRRARKRRKKAVRIPANRIGGIPSQRKSLFDATPLGRFLKRAIVPAEINLRDTRKRLQDLLAVSNRNVEAMKLRVSHLEDRLQRRSQRDVDMRASGLRSWRERRALHECGLGPGGPFKENAFDLILRHVATGADASLLAQTKPVFVAVRKLSEDRRGVTLKVRRRLPDLPSRDGVAVDEDSVRFGRSFMLRLVSLERPRRLAIRRRRKKKQPTVPAPAESAGVVASEEEGEVSVLASVMPEATNPAGAAPVVRSETDLDADRMEIRKVVRRILEGIVVSLETPDVVAAVPAEEMKQLPAVHDAERKTRSLISSFVGAIFAKIRSTASNGSFDNAAAAAMVVDPRVASFFSYSGRGAGGSAPSMFPTLLPTDPLFSPVLAVRSVRLSADSVADLAAAGFLTPALTRLSPTPLFGATFYPLEDAQLLSDYATTWKLRARTPPFFSESTLLSVARSLGEMAVLLSHCGVEHRGIGMRSIWVLNEGKEDRGGVRLRLANFEDMQVVGENSTVDGSSNVVGMGACLYSLLCPFTTRHGEEGLRDVSPFDSETKHYRELPDCYAKDIRRLIRRMMCGHSLPPSEMLQLVEEMIEQRSLEEMMENESPNRVR